MMDNTPAKKMPKITQKSSHPAAIFSFYPRKCLTNSGRYILSQGTEENSNAICSLRYPGISMEIVGQDWLPSQQMAPRYQLAKQKDTVRGPTRDRMLITEF